MERQDQEPKVQEPKVQEPQILVQHKYLVVRTEVVKPYWFARMLEIDSYRKLMIWVMLFGVHSGMTLLFFAYGLGDPRLWTNWFLLSPLIALTFGVRLFFLRGEMVYVTSP